MKHLVIKSNSGNHEGYNVKWTLLSESSTKKEAKKQLLNHSFGLSDDHILKNGRAFDTDTMEYVCTNKSKGFVYDGYKYLIINNNDLDQFNGGNYGYLPEYIIELLS
jgi:hypothetical protein